MQNKVCCCFGHRDVSEDIDSSLERILKKLIVKEGVNVFMSGDRGSFDTSFTYTVFRLKDKYPKIQLHLIEPYFTQKLEKNKLFYEFLYDSVIIPEVAANADYKAAIPIRNRWMVDNSDIIVAYIRRDYGGAYNAVKYAEEKNKRIIYVEPQEKKRPLRIMFR